MSLKTQCSCGNHKTPYAKQCLACYRSEQKCRHPYPVKRGGKCGFPGCKQPVQGIGLCLTHLLHYRKGKVLAPIKLVPRHRDPVCTVDGCNRKHCAFGYCKKHYTNFKACGDPLGRRHCSIKGVCSVEGCDREVSGKQLCQMHLIRLRKNGDVGPVGRIYKHNKGVPCSVCFRPASVRGLCPKHYSRTLRHDDPLVCLQEKNKRHLGDRFTVDGSVMVKTKDGLKREARINAEKSLRRPLLKEECVLHIDGDSTNNDPLNLLIQKKAERRLRQCYRCGEITSVGRRKFSKTKKSLCTKCIKKLRMTGGPKLSISDVKMMRFLHSEHECSYISLAKLFRVCVDTVQNTCSGETWKNISLLQKREEVQSWLTRKNSMKLENFGVTVESLLMTG